MIEQKVAGFGFFEVELESDQTNKGVFQKLVSGLPRVCAFWANLERIHF
jgi:hypothetical protein